MNNRAKIINVKIERSQSGLFRATSPDMSSVHVAANTLEKVHELAKLMIADLFAAEGKQVEVFEVEEQAPTAMSPWVVVPKGTQSASF